MIWTYYNSFFVPNKRYGYFLSTDTFWFDVGQVVLSKPFVKVEYFLTFSWKSHISTRRWWQIFENLFSKCSFEDQYIKIDETDCKWSQTFQIFISIKMLIVHSRVFQNFWENGNQRFLGTSFAPGRRKTLRFAKKLRFLLSPGLQRWLGSYIIHIVHP